jgi:uncharacterized integral membrane protein
MNAKFISILILVGISILFILQNVADVEIRFLFWSVEMPRAIFMFLLLLVGTAIGWIMHEHYNEKSK